MDSYTKKDLPQQQKLYHLSLILSQEDQMRFLDLLISTVGLREKRELIERALIGERVWDRKKAL